MVPPQQKLASDPEVDYRPHFFVARDLGVTRDSYPDDRDATAEECGWKRAAVAPLILIQEQWAS
jgi:hypothetical protein